jgi:hypothetical protein
MEDGIWRNVVLDSVSPGFADRIPVMSTEIINIRVDAEVAKVFKALSEGDRRRLEAILSIRLTEITQRPESLDAVMQESARKPGPVG